MKKICVVLCFLMLIGVFSGCAITRKQHVARELSNYDIHAELHEDNTVKARQTVTYINKSQDVLSEVVFNLAPNGYRKGATHTAIAVEEYNRAYPNGISYGGIDISNVNVNGADCLFKIGGEDLNALIVPLNVELFPDDRVEIEIAFTVKLANVKHRLGYTENAVNLGNWYPTIAVYEDFEFKTYPYYSKGDPFYYDCANYRVTFTFPKKYTAAHSGVLEDKKNSETSTTYIMHEEAIRDFAIVLSDKFNLITKNVDGVNILYYYIDDSEMVQSFLTCENSFKLYVKSFGTYDYKNLSIVQTDFLQGGMEFSNLVYISLDVKGKSYQEVIAHEIAHQWWYMMVGSNQVESAWIDEGLTEFSTAYYFLKQGNGSMMQNGEKGYRGYLKLYDSFQSPINSDMNRHLKDYTSTVEYVAMAYSKGQMLFVSLYNELKEENFLKGAREYFNLYRHEIASKDRLIYAFSKGSGRTLEGFINGYMTARIFLK